MTFAGVVGGASAGLIGLTFIVTAIRFEVIAVSVELRNRVGQALAVLVAVLMVAIALALPQRAEALGAELLVVAFAAATALTRLDRSARRVQVTPTPASLLLATASFVGSVTAAGVVLLAGDGWGRFLLAAGSAIGLTWAVYTAWRFLTHAGSDSDDDSTQSRTSADPPREELRP